MRNIIVVLLSKLKVMEGFLKKILTPSSLVSLVLSLAAFWASYSLLSYRVDVLENEVKEIDAGSIMVTLASIQTDLQWIKTNIMNFK